MKNRTKKISSSVLVIGFIMGLISCDNRSSLNEMRTDLDTTYFTGKHPSYSADIREAMMKSEYYQNFLHTNQKDSLGLYIKMAEVEAMRSLNKK